MTLLGHLTLYYIPSLLFSIISAHKKLEKMAKSMRMQLFHKLVYDTILMTEIILRFPNRVYELGLRKLPVKTQTNPFLS